MAFQQEKKYLEDGINADDAPFIVKPSEMINAVNHRFGTSDNGGFGYNQSLPGTLQVPYTYPLGTNIPIGSAQDDVNNRLIYFVYNDQDNHGIYCYDLPAGKIRVILQNNNINGGFGWDVNRRINNAYVVNGLLYFRDPIPRYINIEAGIKYNDITYVTSVAPYAIGINQTTISLIKKPPNSELSIRKVQSIDIPSIATFTQNFISDGAFQFAARYIYRDNQYSVIGPWSKLASYGYASEALTINAIEIIYQEAIEQDVYAIELIVKLGNDGKAFVIKTWDRDRNPGLLVGNIFTYYFLNDGTGTPVDEVALNKPFDAIPLTSETASLAKNRLFLGNNLLGYDTPIKTSLSLTLTTFPVAGSQQGVWYFLKVIGSVLGDPSYQNNVAYGIFIDFGGTTGRYGYVKSIDLLFMAYVGVNNYPVGGGAPTVAHAPGTYVPPSILYTTDVTNRVDTLTDIEILVRNRTPDFFGYNYFPYSNITSFLTVVLVNTKSTSSTGIRALKSNSPYRTAIAFYDQYRRKCGVVTNDSLRRITPAQNSFRNTYNYYLQWHLSNTSSFAEIPDWAYSYQILRTRNLKYLNFVQGVPTNSTYVTKDANNAFLFTTPTYALTNYGIGIKITELIGHGIGYTYTEGDFATLFVGAIAATDLNLSVIGQYGDWVILSLADAGTLNSTATLYFEIYTPYKESINEAYYEIGEGYPVLDPGTNTRSYSAITGSINGDTYSIQRYASPYGIFVAEAMSPNDRFWQKWETDIGWDNIILKVGQERRVNNIAFSNILIPGTKTNGLSSFDALDTQDLPVDNGPLTALIVTTKVQDEGTVMLAICSNQTSSIYLGETQVIDNNGNLFTATATNVIGTINVLRGNYGSVHAESIKEFRGTVYAYDLRNGVIWQYASNGLFPITNYKMTSFFRTYSKKYNALGATFPMIGGIDPVAEEYLLSLTGLESTGFAATLPTFTDQNEFQIYDGKSKTFSFKLGQQKFSSTFYDYSQLYEFIGTQSFDFYAGQLYKRNDLTVASNFIHGQQQTTKLMFLSNANPYQLKRFSNIAVEANMPPIRVIFYTLNPYEQITDLVVTDFKLKEGVYYAAILRDRLSPNAVGTPDQKLYNGDKMLGAAMYCQIEFDTSIKRLEMKAVNIGSHASVGHSV